MESLELHIIPPNLFPSNLPFCTPVSQTHNPSAEDPHKLQTYGIPCVSDFPSPWIPWTGKGAPALRPFICCVIPEILLSSMSGIPDGYLDFYYDTLDLGKLCPKSVTSVVSKWITWYYTSIYIFLCTMKSYFSRENCEDFLNILRTGRRGRSLVNIWPGNGGLPACFRSINAAGHLGGDWIGHSWISWPTSSGLSSPPKRSPI